MSPMRVGRYSTLCLLLLVGADFASPSLADVFSFERSTFFMDGAVKQLGQASVGRLAPATPAPVRPTSTGVDNSPRLAALIPSAVLDAVRSTRRIHIKHHAPTAPASPEDD
jgi:hypothetical protein